MDHIIVLSFPADWQKCDTEIDICNTELDIRNTELDIQYVKFQ